MNKYLLLFVLAALPATTIAQEKDKVAEETIRKAITAAGGEGRFNTLKAPTMWMETGTYYGMGGEVPFVAQYASYWPKRWYRQLIEGQFAMGVAGDQVTVFMGNNRVGQKISGPRAAGALHQARVSMAPLLYPLLEEDYKLSSSPGVEVEGKPTVGIKAVHNSKSELKLYFDKSSYLLVKTEAKIALQEQDGKIVNSETFFRDHQSFGGAKLPSKYRILYDGELIVEGEHTAIKTHATIDPAWFGVEGPARVR